jgi:hypothetical protein
MPATGFKYSNSWHKGAALIKSASTKIANYINSERKHLKVPSATSGL